MTTRHRIATTTQSDYHIIDITIEYYLHRLSKQCNEKLLKKKKKKTYLILFSNKYDCHSILVAC